jgi:uncharacterized protein involved in response to NO
MILPRPGDSFRKICEEPFRIFFPAGIALGVLGVSLWLLYFAGASITYPNISHARLMIEGLMGSFIFGFLGTAGPRITSASPLSPVELAIVFGLDLVAAGAHFNNAHQVGDFVFLICLLVFVVALVRRFVKRKDSPPPNFALVALGLVSGIAGTIMVAVSEPDLFSRTYRFGNALLSECFVLLPVLGVAPFFIRRLLDLPTPDVPESRALPPGWKRRAGLAAFIGSLLIASFLIEAVKPSPLVSALRAVIVAVYVLTGIPLSGRSTLAHGLRSGLAMIVVALIGLIFWPIWRIGWFHLLFIAGFNLIALSVATRVVLGHSGHLQLLPRRMWFFGVSAILITLAAISRLGAEISPQTRTLHLVSAAICWLVAVVIWTAVVMPKVRIVGDE